MLIINKIASKKKLLAKLSLCEKPCVLIKSKPGIIPWRHSNDRAQFGPTFYHLIPLLCQTPLTKRTGKDFKY